MTYQSPLHDVDHLDLARDLARDLAHTLAHTHNLNHVLARALVRTLDHTFTQARPLDVDAPRDLNRAVARARARARAHAHALTLARDLDHARELDHTLTRELAFTLARDLDHARELDQILIFVIRQDLHRINVFIDRWERLDASAEAKQPLTAKEESAPVAHLAECLVDVVMRLLPARHQGRYTEEFKAELHDLAQAKATGTAQVVYTLQQLGRVWHLREALLTPDRPRFHRLRRAAYWVLTSNWRTWGLLGPLLTFGVVNIHLSQGWGSALFTLPGIVGFYAGVEWLRKRWDMEVKRADKTAGDLSNE